MQRRLSSIVPIVASVLCFAATARAQCHYQVTVLPTINCGLTIPDGGTPLALNKYGQIAGKHSQCLHDGDEAFAWNPGQLTLGTLPRPPGIFSATASGISDVLGSTGMGQVVGEAEVAGGYKAFLWESGNWTILPAVAGATQSEAIAISDNGSLIVGVSLNNVNGMPFAAAIWRNGAVQALNLPYGPHATAMCVDPSGTLVGGWMGIAYGNASRAFLWENGKVTDIGIPPGAIAGAARAVNSRRQVLVVGRADQTQPPGYYSRSYLWESGNWTDLGMIPGNNWIAATSMNDRSEIIEACRLLVGSAIVSETDWVWREGRFTDLSLAMMPGSGIDPGVSPRAINDQGQIVAEASIDNHHSGVTVLLSPMPGHLGDTDCNGIVNIDDLVRVITNWGPCPGAFCSTDLDHSGAIDVNDLILVLVNWDSSPQR